MKDRIKCGLWALFFFGGIGLWSCGGKKITVRKTPKSHEAYTFQDCDLRSSFPTYSKPWIVFSAQEGSAVYASEKESQADKQAVFFEAYVVLKKKGDRYKVAKYNAGSLVDGQIDKTQVEVLGWIGEKDLLLWSESLQSATSGFRMKGLLTLRDPYVITHSERFVQSDSISLFKDPSLLHLSAAKMPVNAVVYLYKFSDDKKRVLIGARPKIEPDQLDNMPFGWIDARVLSLWGERTAFRIKPTPGVPAIQIGLGNPDAYAATFTPVISSDTIRETCDFYHIYPLTYRWSKDVVETRYWDHFLDYTENRVYNVEGQPIDYLTYKNGMEEHRKLNVVFVLDGSREVMQHVASFKAMIQELATQFEQQSYFHSISYSTFFYGVDPVVKQDSEVHRTDFPSWSQSFDTPVDFHETNAVKTSLYQSIEEVRNTLEGLENQSNLVVVIGENIQAQDREKQQDLIAKMVDTHSRLIFYQTQANYSDTFNDFVLFAEEVISTSSAQLKAHKKQQLIHHEDVVEWNEFDLSQGNQGVYQLDYPLRSMHQGAVLFPKKGQVNAPLLLQKTLKSMMHSIVVDNQKIDSTLTAAFKSNQGLSRTKIKSMYLPFFEFEQQDVPISIAAQLADQTCVFLQQGTLKRQEDTKPDVLEYGVLLDEEELEQVRDYYLSIYMAVFKNKNLTNRRMIRRYIRVARDKSLLDKKPTRKFLLDNTLSIGLFQGTGLYAMPSDSLSKLPLKQWKKTRWMKVKVLEDFFAGFKTKANEMEEHKGDKNVRLQQQGQFFYWLDQTYIPLLHYRAGKEKDNRFDFLPVELEQHQGQNPKNQINENHAKDYIERVKRGMP